MTTPASGAFKELPYSLKLRFENEDGTKGTNPEELIAAAHSGCYAMALSVGLEKAGYEAEVLDCEAVVSLEQVDDGWEISRSDLKLKATVPGISKEEFGKIAEGAKEGCPVSQLLNCEITLDYTFNG